MSKPVRVRKYDSEKDYRAMRTAALSVEKRTEGLRWHRHIDIFKCMEAVVKGEVNSVVVEDTYLLLYHFGTPWYSKDVMLEEQLVLKIHEGGGRFSDIPRALEGLAKHHGAVGVFTGTALASSNRALSRLYQREGFTPEAVALYKPTE